MFVTGIQRKDGAARSGRFPWTQSLMAGLERVEALPGAAIWLLLRRL